MDNSGKPQKLPVLAIFCEALLLPQKHFQLLIRYGLPVLILGILAITISSYQVNGGGFTGLLVALLGLGIILSLVLAVVSCHRIFLLDRDAVLRTPVLRWTMRETHYVIGWISIGLILFAIGLSVMPFVVPMLDNLANSVGKDGIQYWVFSNVLYLPLLYIGSRWMLLLPAVAVDSPRKRMGAAWTLSKNNGWRLTVLICLPTFVFGELLTLLESYETFALYLLQYCLSLFLGVIELGILSLSYAWLRDNSSPEAQKNTVDAQKPV